MSSHASSSTATFRPKTARFFATATACIAVGLTLFFLIKDVNKGGSAAHNLIFLWFGAAMCVVGLVSGGVGLKQLLLAPSVAIDQDNVAVSWRGRKVDRWPLVSIERANWGILASGSGSGTLWSDIYHAIKPKGLYLRLSPLVIVLERYQTGMCAFLRKHIPGQVPLGLIEIRHDLEKEDRWFPLFIGDSLWLRIDDNSMSLHVDTQDLSHEAQIMLSAGNEGQLLLTVLRSCTVSGVDARTGSKFTVSPDLGSGAAIVKEHDVSAHPFKIEQWTISFRRVE